jgi:hypothetical protein
MRPVSGEVSDQEPPAGGARRRLFSPAEEPFILVAAAPPVPEPFASPMMKLPVSRLLRTAALLLPLALPPSVPAQRKQVAQAAAPTLPSAVAHQGDVADVRVLRRVEQHPHAWKIWQPFIL